MQVFPLSIPPVMTASHGPAFSAMQKSYSIVVYILMSSAHTSKKSGRPDFSGDTIIRFDEVSFEYGHNKPILDEVDSPCAAAPRSRSWARTAQAKARSSALILGAGAGERKGISPESGQIHITNGATIATARQVIPRDQMELTVREFFAKSFKEKKYDLDPRIDDP
jgi:ATPase subunit of ABC transporter with duplicated ATPase domains